MINILLADDHEILREGLCKILEKDSELKVIGQACDGIAAVEMTTMLRPDIVIMDIAMPNLNGIEATRQIVVQMPDVKILALSMYTGIKFIQKVLKAGARGYILKDCASTELINAIKTVVKNQIYLSPKITNVVISDYLENKNDGQSNSDKLSNRERQVVQLIAEGWTTKQIGLKMNISSKTVDTYRQRIMNKLEIYNIADLIKFAIYEGITSINF